MFTGIIEGLGTITAVRPAGSGKRLAITADFPLNGTKIGDSIAVNGACLTAVTIADTRFEVDMSPETVEKTCFKQVKIGERANIERALRLSDRLDGHLVSGHIDGTGRITHKTRNANAILVGFSVPETLARYLIPKGSVAIDGISLTVNRCDQHSFEVSIIPHTAGLTTIGFKNIGDMVNLETDMIGKYVEKFLTGGKGNEPDKNSNKSVDMEYLLKTGFI
ncbi:MAG: riboflavin synthase [Desulfobacteraceae bacterium]|nr:MAG: riboflavin synthase [Desulfobacteraceae bacterium]